MCNVIFIILTSSIKFQVILQFSKLHINVIPIVTAKIFTTVSSFDFYKNRRHVTHAIT